MQDAKRVALAVSKYFVALPHPAKTTIAVFAVSFIFGVLFSIAKWKAHDPLSLFAGGSEGILILGFPAAISSLVLYLLRRKATFRRAAFLGLLTVLCYGLFYLAAFALEGAFPMAGNLVFVGFGAAFCLWYFLLVLAFDFRKSAVFFALMQLLLFAFFFLVRPGFGSGADPADVIGKVALSSAVLVAALYLMFYVISAPMKKNLGISSMDALSMFLSQWLYGEKDLEGVFEELGEDVETLVWLCRFMGRKSEVLFVVPSIHFGPFGNLGGSEFTRAISEALAKKGREVFVFHGTATHDFNPVSSGEIGRVVGACERALLRLRLARAKMSIAQCKVGSVRASAMRVNDAALLSFTRAPQTTEDINLGLGLAIMERARRHASSIAVVDEHNAETGDITSVEAGSPIGFEMLDAAEKALSSPHRMEGFRLGSSSCQLAIDTLGKNGLKLALFARGRRLHAILLCDSNSVTPEFRDELRWLMASLGKEAGFSCKGEVMTTDTHQINTVRGVLHPLGADSRGDVASAVRDLFFKAVENLEPVKFGSETERFRIKVFGAGQSIEIASTLNAVFSLMKLVLPLVLLGAIALLLWYFAR
jgi:putative membrane protein